MVYCYITPFKNGKKEGLDKLYYENGKVKKEIIYEAGKAINGLFYKPDGTKNEMEKAAIDKLNK